MKQKTRRKLLSFLLALAMAVGLLPGAALAASVTPYDLWIEGTRVTSNNSSGTGWSYAASQTKLTLNNLYYSQLR